MTYIPIENIEESYRGRLLRIFTQNTRLQNGKVIAFEYAERSPGVRALIFNKSGILLTKEWRLEHNAADMRLPGGKVFESLNDYLKYREISDSELHSLAANAASKELFEEAGVTISPDQFNILHTSKCGATIVWDLLYMSAEVLDPPANLRFVSSEEGEQVTPCWITWDEALKYCLDGSVSEDRTAAVLLRFMFHNNLISA